jgi:Bifunctional DNA primase/polymerase, N-terminal
MRAEVVHAMQELLAAGVSVCPVRPDGSKAALISWHAYQIKRATDSELSCWVSQFRGIDAGLAIVAGRASGNAEAIDIDDIALVEPWEAMIEQIIPGLVERLVAVRTPRPGMSLWYRCSAITGNQKLAQALDGNGKPKTLIETRGLGGYALIPPSPPACHPLQQPYVLLRGDLANIPTVTPDERGALLNSARTFNTYINPAKVVARSRFRVTPVQPVGDRPGDIFATLVSWAELLESHGWRLAGSRGELTFWCRPGKFTGHSATTGLGHHGEDLLYVFSTNAAPFEAGTSYSKFGALALLDYHGDFREAARSLASHPRFSPHQFWRQRAVLVNGDPPWRG